MGYLKKVGTSFIWLGVFLAAITFLPGLPPTSKFSEYSITSPKELTGLLATNNRLNNAELLFKGELKGAEAFASYNGELYTGIHGGYVVKITDKQMIPIVKFGQECDGLWQEAKCGRPLGLKFDDKGALYVCDAYYGIFKVNVKSGKYETIVDSRKLIDGKRPMITNFLDIAKNGDIYWSDSSTEFRVEDGIFTMLGDPSGRLIRYNAAKKENEVLVHNLAFANGVMLSKNEDFVIVLETLASRITKFNLKGPKAGKREIFIEGLPGMPDNVHSDGQGGFLVSLVVPANSENPVLAQTLMPHPNLRKMVVRFLALLELPFKFAQGYYPNPYFERCVHFIGNFESMLFMSPSLVTVLRINEEGKIIDASYANDGKISGISSAYIHNNYLYLGSPWADFIARVPLKQAFPDLVGVKNMGAGNTQEQKTQKKVVQNDKPKSSTKH